MDEGTLLRDDDGAVVGRDFTGRGLAAPEPASYAVRGRGRVIPRPAPWQNPYMVVARAAGHAVEVTMPGRTFRVDSADELAMLISYDSRRPRGADIVWRCLRSTPRPSPSWSRGRPAAASGIPRPRSTSPRTPPPGRATSCWT